MATDSSANDLYDLYKKISELLATTLAFIDNSSLSGEEASDLDDNAKSAIATDLYDKKIDELLANIDSSSSSGEDASDVDDNAKSAIGMKSVKDTNKGQRLLIEELKLLKKHFKVILKEKNDIIQEKNRILEEKNRITDEMRDNINLLKLKLQTMTEKKINLLEEVKEKDGEIEKLKMQLDLVMQQQVDAKRQETVSKLSTTNDYPKKVLLIHVTDCLGLGFSRTSDYGVCLSSVKRGSPAARAGLRVNDRLLEMGGVDLRKATVDLATQVLRQCGPVVCMIVDLPSQQ